MTFDDMLAFVRAQADADATDAPNSLLEVHARVAYNDILSRRGGWNHFEVHYDLTTVAGQQEYTISSLSASDMQRVYSITSNTALRERLTPVTRSDADIIFGLTQTQGTPTAYNIYNDKIVFYPIPSAARPLKVHGFRAPAVWPNGTGSIPDLPAEFHEAIAWYMLSGFYLSQEDQNMAGMYMNEYQQMVARALTGSSNIQQQPRPRILGGASIGNYRPFTERVRGMLE
jgi:hypothetical protein